MPKFRYEGRDNFKLVDEGEYPLYIEDYEWEISKGAKTSGADVLILTLSILDPKTFQPTGAKAWERLIFAEKTAWRIDVFLKSIKAAPAIGTDMNIEEDFCETHIKGATGWGSVTVEEYEGKKQNRIAQWLTGDKLPEIKMAKKEEKGFE